MSFPRYERYKDSGMEWLGEVPEHWQIRKINSLSTKITNGYVGPTRDILVDEGVRYLQSLHIKGNRIKFNEPYFVTKDWSEEHKKSILEKDDVLIVQTGDIGQVAVIPEEFAGCNCHALIIVTPIRQVVSGEWLAWIFNADYGKHSLLSIQTGALHPHLNCGNVKNIFVPIPTPPEQSVIATFLDRETTKIDALIAEQQRLIELLKEKRQSVISHAVTKGLDPNVPMKDSGVEWLGEVPEHWEVKCIKRLIVSIEQGWSPQCEGFPVETRDEWGILKVGCVNGGRFNPNENKALPADLEPIPALGIAANDILISRANTRELVGSAAVTCEAYPKLMLCDKLYRLRLIHHLCLSNFIVLCLGSGKIREQIELGATGASSSMLNIGQSVILELHVPLPPVEEQSKITSFLDRTTTKIDTLTAEAQNAITLLKERRTALLSAAVTGKIDVRGLVAASPEGETTA